MITEDGVNLAFGFSHVGGKPFKRTGKQALSSARFSSPIITWHTATHPLF